MSRPFKLPRWADVTAGAIVEPTEAQKDSGWADAQKPPAKFLNWLLNGGYEFIKYLDAVVTGSNFWFEDDFVGTGIDAGKWVVSGAPSVVFDNANGGYGAAQLRANANGQIHTINTSDLPIGTADFIFSTRFRFNAALNSATASFILGLYPAFWLESDAAEGTVVFRYDGGGAFPANSFVTALSLNDLTYHEVQIMRLAGNVYLMIDGVLATSFADVYNIAEASVLAKAIDVTSTCDLIVDYTKLWIDR